MGAREMRVGQLSAIMVFCIVGMVLLLLLQWGGKELGRTNIALIAHMSFRSCLVS